MSANMCVDLCPYILDVLLFINALYSAQIPCSGPKTVTTMVINHFRHDERHPITDAAALSMSYVSHVISAYSHHGSHHLMSS